MPAGGFKTFVANEILTAADTNDYLMQGVLVFASAAARTSAITSPVEGQFSFRTDDDVVEFYDGSAWTALSSTQDFEFLVVAGGGGGGRHFGGGGGAGGYLADSIAMTGASFTVTVGAGGSGGTGANGTPGTNGVSSGFDHIYSAGGGGGGCRDANRRGLPGGSAGGPGGDNAAQGAAIGLSPWGNNSGNNTGQGGAGGGGAGGVGADGVYQTVVAGGLGTANSITGSSVTYSAGGGGAGTSSATGGGSGTINGGTNLGGGGGGGGSSLNAGNGGSGVVILKYPDSITLTIGGGLTSSTSTSGGFKITSFTAGTDTVSF